MGDIKLFSIDEGNTHELRGESLAVEKSLQQVIENNAEKLLGINFLATEYTTGKNHAGRIDTLAIDENYSPVIIEYKRTTNENVINQGLFYLDWLLDHKAEFELIVMKKLGREFSDKIDWSSPRLLCIAGGFTRYDEHAVKQINRNIELYRYKYFENKFLMLDLVNATFTFKSKEKTVDNTYEDNEKDTYLSKQLSFSDENVTNLYYELYEYLMSMGEDVQFKELKFYLAFKRIKNFACVEILPNQQRLLLYVKVDMSNVVMEERFTRDVSKIGHYGTGNLSLEIRSKEDLEKAKKFIDESYENN
ncbi:DUF5655 domain-containing protein [Staphylococcus caprae]|uniref:DUF5655 domain-containing protein n=1 Tax=Staphylococcus caprae TaxID=29380 RepID=A0ABM7FRE5_9STAP|nr:DUF5655 domain-containing protein [Staphylococcus caprae]EES41390.1 hypothetical protein HMPREF0793_1014 [Staphylococcus caprae M23864:W1]MBX5317746.1 DUF91 domain-containing protein [Staphylococcus caprae]MBX5323794.1 DUF91 domain-containing protein [Staphylococcus caprae]MDI0015625.1 DUF5655 domain-containing protein [Staphylococcus caprae]MEB8095577.1 DUF5655 domain-containing protein [Staphylococcus caprae]